MKSTLAKLIVAALIVGGLVAGVVPWRLARSNLAAAIAASAAQGTGLAATVAGPVTVKLLPRPRIQATEVAIAADDGAVLVDAPVLKAELDIPSLLRGVWRLSSATLVEPTITLDADRLAERAALRPEGGDAPAPPRQLRLRSGILRIRSATPLADMLATGVDASLSWPADGDGMVISGGGSWRGTPIRFTGRLDHASQSVTTAGSAASLRIESPVFNFSADGILSGGRQEQFAGRTSLTTSVLPTLLRKFDGVPFILSAARAQVSGDLLAKPHDLSLSNAQLLLDHARFEGTLAWRRDAGRGLVAGTLATDRLDIDALMGTGGDGQVLDAFYRRSLETSPFGTDVDMRISASTARLGRFTVDDLAGAALVRGDRLELSLDEARGYGGVAKARAVAVLGPHGIDTHADVSTTKLDLARFSDALQEDDRVAGTLSGHATLDGRGASFRDVVANLAGQGHVVINAGRLAGLSVARVLRRLGRRPPLEADRRATPTTFDQAQWDIVVSGGVVRIPDGKLTAPGVAMTFGAEAALPDGHVDIHALATQTDGGGIPLRDGPHVPFVVRGSWTEPLVLVGHGLPTLGVPLFGDSASGR